MSHSFSCSMEISRMHQKFENWNDMRHEPRKFWLAETIFFNLCKIIPLATGNHRHPFSVFFFSEEGGGCTRAIPSSRVFFNHAHIIYS